MNTAHSTRIVDIGDGLGIILPQSFMERLPDGTSILECEVVDGSIMLSFPKNAEEKSQDGQE